LVSGDKRKSPKSKLHYPQEIEVWFVIPAIHRNLAQKFKELNLSQKKIAAILGVTEACVSQYISGIRGTKVTFSESIQDEIAKAAKKIHFEGAKVVREVQKICMIVKSSGLRCELHREYGKANESCRICKGIQGLEIDE
jgi:predicted transcriptional regulator